MRRKLKALGMGRCGEVFTVGQRLRQWYLLLNSSLRRALLLLGASCLVLQKSEEMVLGKKVRE